MKCVMAFICSGVSEPSQKLTDLKINHTVQQPHLIWTLQTLKMEGKLELFLPRQRHCLLEEQGLADNVHGLGCRNIRPPPHVLVSR